jgi:hypothetical protein
MRRGNERGVRFGIQAPEETSAWQRKGPSGEWDGGGTGLVLVGRCWSAHSVGKAGEGLEVQAKTSWELRSGRLQRLSRHGRDTASVPCLAMGLIEA